MPEISHCNLRPQGPSCPSVLCLLIELPLQVSMQVDGSELAHIVVSKHLEGLVFFYYCVHSPLPL